MLIERLCLERNNTWVQFYETLAHEQISKLAYGQQLLPFISKTLFKTEVTIPNSFIFIIMKINGLPDFEFRELFSVAEVTRIYSFQHETIPMNSMGPPPHPNLPSPGYTTDGHAPHMDPSPRSNYPPPGGVPLFPNLPPVRGTHLTKHKLS